MLTSNQTVSSILGRVLDGERLSKENALILLESRELAAIGSAANQITERLHPATFAPFTVLQKAVRVTSCREPSFFRKFKRQSSWVAIKS